MSFFSKRIPPTTTSATIISSTIITTYFGSLYISPEAVHPHNSNHGGKGRKEDLLNKSDGGNGRKDDEDTVSTQIGLADLGKWWWQHAGEAAVITSCCASHETALHTFWTEEEWLVHMEEATTGQCVYKWSHLPHRVYQWSYLTQRVYEWSHLPHRMSLSVTECTSGRTSTYFA